MGEASEQGGDSAGNEHRPGQHHDHHVLHVPVVVALVAIVVFFAAVARVARVAIVFIVSPDVCIVCIVCVDVCLFFPLEFTVIVCLCFIVAAVVAIFSIAVKVTVVASVAGVPIARVKTVAESMGSRLPEEASVDEKKGGD